MHFLLRARAIAVFPGGFGTMDEMFETLTLIQTGRMERIPFLLFGERFWRRVIDLDALAEEGTISPDDLNLFRFVDSGEEAWAADRGALRAGIASEVPPRGADGNHDGASRALAFHRARVRAPARETRSWATA